MEIVLLEKENEYLKVRKLKKKFKEKEELHFSDFKDIDLIYFEPHDILSSVLDKIAAKQNKLNHKFYSNYVAERSYFRYIGILYSSNFIYSDKADAFFNFILSLNDYELDDIFDAPVCTINKEDKESYCLNKNFYVYSEI